MLPRSISSLLAVPLLVLTALAGCTQNPASGGYDFRPLMSDEQAARAGAQQHGQILKRFGGAYRDPDLAAYVDQVGQWLVSSSELARARFTFTVLDTPVVNAFALPGGYIYVTRGLLALVNSTAELAAVLAHEIGHVTARHSVKRYHRAAGSNLFATALGLLTGSQDVARAAAYLGQGFVAGYSRDQEYEADSLGARYLVHSGYDPLAGARFLNSMRRDAELQRQLAGKRKKQKFGFFSTHPNTGDRVERAEAAARQMAKRDKINLGAAVRGRAGYLAKIDGMIYGGSSASGFLRGRRYVHREADLTFAVPKKFTLEIASGGVLARGPAGTIMIFDAPKKFRSKDPFRYLTTEWTRNKRTSNARRIRVNGLDAAVAVAHTRYKGRDMIVRLAVVRHSEKVLYRFLFLSDVFEASGAFSKILESFRRLGPADLQRWKPWRIRVVRVKAGDRVAKLAKRMAPADRRQRRFRVLNGLGAKQRLKAGELLKIVSE